MKTTDGKKALVSKIQEEYLARTIGEHLTLIQSRPGESKREAERIKKWLELPNVTKRTKISDVLEILHPKKHAKSDAGFTVIELLIAGAMLVILGLIVSAVFRRTGGSTMNSAEEFARKIDPKATVDCTSRDSDGDGYVSCTVFRPNGAPIGIECAAALTWNSGCRMARVQGLGRTE